MSRTALGAAVAPHPQDTERRPGTGLLPGRPGAGEWLTQRRVVDFGLANTMRCR